MSEISELFQRLAHIETDVAAIKANVSNYHELYAKQSWVRDELHIIQQSMAQMANSLTKFQEVLTQSQKQSDKLFVAHEEFLQAEAKRKEEKHAAEMTALQGKTMGAWFQNLGKAAGLIVGCAAAAVALSPVLQAILKAVLNVR